MLHGAGIFTKLGHFQCHKLLVYRRVPRRFRGSRDFGASKLCHTCALVTRGGLRQYLVNVGQAKKCLYIYINLVLVKNAFPIISAINQSPII